MEMPPTDVEEGGGMVTFRPASGMEDAFEALADLPTYRVERIRKITNTRRLMRLARLLTTLHQIDAMAWDEAKQLIIATLDAERDRLKAEDANFDALINAEGEIIIQAVTVEQGTWQESHGETIRVLLDEKNIEDLFQRAGQRLGEGLHLDYWQSHYDKDIAAEMPHRTRLELFLVLQDEKAWKNLEKVCGERVNALMKTNKGAIKKLPSAEREEYNKIQELAKEPEPLVFLPPGEIMLAVDAQNPAYRAYARHLYVNGQGQFITLLNGWEEAVIKAEIACEDVVGWLRNVERKPWALALPYDRGGQTKAMYPDFLVVRREGTGLVVDILEPHAPALADSYAKARGLAQFAARHWDQFGRIELIRLVDNEIRRLDLANPDHRVNVAAIDSNDALDVLFGILAD